MRIKSSGWYAVELWQSSFGKQPKTFGPVNVNIANGENIVRMINPQMFRAAGINQRPL